MSTTLSAQPRYESAATTDQPSGPLTRYPDAPRKGVSHEYEPEDEDSANYFDFEGSMTLYPDDEGEGFSVHRDPEENEGAMPRDDDARKSWHHDNFRILQDEYGIDADALKASLEKDGETGAYQSGRRAAPREGARHLRLGLALRGLPRGRQLQRGGVPPAHYTPPRTAATDGGYGAGPLPAGGYGAGPLSGTEPPNGGVDTDDHEMVGEHRCDICRAKDYEHAWWHGWDAMADDPDTDEERETAKEEMAKRKPLRGSMSERDVEGRVSRLGQCPDCGTTWPNGAAVCPGCGVREDQLDLNDLPAEAGGRAGIDPDFGLRSAGDVVQMRAPEHWQNTEAKCACGHDGASHTWEDSDASNCGECGCAGFRTASKTADYDAQGKEIDEVDRYKDDGSTSWAAENDRDEAAKERAEWGAGTSRDQGALASAAPGKFEGNPDGRLAESLYQRTLEEQPDAAGDSVQGPGIAWLLPDHPDGKSYVGYEDTQGFFQYDAFDSAREARDHFEGTVRPSLEGEYDPEAEGTQPSVRKEDR